MSDEERGFRGVRMKKIFILFGVIVLFGLMLSLPLVSAGLIGDVGNI